MISPRDDAIADTGLRPFVQLDAEAPRSDIARMRDLIVHQYKELDAAIVSATTGEPLDRLRAACEALLADDTD